MYRVVTCLWLFSSASFAWAAGAPQQADEANPPANAVQLLNPRKIDPPAAQPAPAQPGPALSAPEPDLKALDQQAAQLKAQREKLNAVRSEQSPDFSRAGTDCSEDIIKMRLRLAALLTRIGTERKDTNARPPVPARPATEHAPVPNPATEPPAVASPEMNKLPRRPAPSFDNEPKPVNPRPPLPEIPPTAKDAGKPSLADLEKPLDPMGLAQALFQTGDYESALATYRLLDLTSLGKVDRPAAQYMMATCLRKLGKLDEAAVLYREVVNAKEDEALAECAQWQLSAFRWRHDLEGQLEQLRQRRQAMEIKP